MEDKIKICILVFTNTQNRNGASRIRPKKIINQFNNFHKNVDTYLLREGERKTSLIFNLLFNKKKYNLCYIEPHTFPLSIKEKIIIKVLKSKGCWISYFYRDLYWKFGVGKDLMNKNKWGKLYKAQIKTLDFLYAHINKIYTPSDSFLKNMPGKNSNNISSLPPGGEVRKINYSPNKREGAIYVGGISERYGTDKMLKSFKKINENQYIPLFLVCRIDDYKKYINIFNQYKKEAWLKIYHLNENELDKIYAKVRIALLPIKNTDYNNLSLSYKIFEYASYGIPIFSTNTYEHIKLIDESNIGINIDNPIQTIENTITNYYHNENELSKLSKACLSFIRENGSWERRYKTIINDYEKK